MDFEALFLKTKLARNMRIDKIQEMKVFWISQNSVNGVNGKEGLDKTDDGNTPC